jgi:hypothetical protein
MAGSLQAYVSATHKQVASTFAGISANRKESGNSAATTRIIGGADIYEGDFGTTTFIPHAYGLTRDMLLIDPSMVAVAIADPFKDVPLAKTGDNERYLMTIEAALHMRNERAHGVVADLT